MVAERLASLIRATGGAGTACSYSSGWRQSCRCPGCSSSPVSRKSNWLQIIRLVCWGPPDLGPIGTSSSSWISSWHHERLCPLLPFLLLSGRGLRCGLGGGISLSSKSKLHHPLFKRCGKTPGRVRSTTSSNGPWSTASSSGHERHDMIDLSSMGLRGRMVHDSYNNTYRLVHMVCAMGRAGSLFRPGPRNRHGPFYSSRERFCHLWRC